MSAKKSAIIIGGGLGGLFLGAFLAKNGLQISVLEKNRIIGGGLQCFVRNKKMFETGMHVMGGFEHGGSLHKLCNYLGILDSLNIQHVPEECIDELYFANDKRSYRIPSGKKNFIEALSRYFPNEAQGIRKYVDALFEITEELPLFNLNEVTDSLEIHSEQFTEPADKLISRYIVNRDLQNILAYLNPLYGGVKGHTPAYIHALINVLFIKGASRFIGGSQQLADALAGVIKMNGGEVIPDSEVCSINVADGKITSLNTVKGLSYSADYVISTIHPAYLSKMLPSGAFRRSYTQRLNEIKNSCSAFSVYIDLKPGSFKYIDHTCYHISDSDRIWNQNQYNRSGKIESFMYMTPPVNQQGEFAEKLLIYAVMDFDEWKRWEHSKLGKRGDDYESLKLKYQESILDKLEESYPGFREKIAGIYTSSPLTIRDYYHTKNGAIFGYLKDSDNLNYSHIGTRTRISNLLLAGQNVNMHGICGVPLNALYTAEQIIGRNQLIREINEVYNKS
ncbi:MAG: NAD(P)/FAD-dependent oxidoreductase [Muribaculaceae bacterium]|nr:NAD(P)/FAD-dependent oxidoreductase [Muribaculaceae bacterium]